MQQWLRICQYKTSRLSFLLHQPFIFQPQNSPTTLPTIRSSSRNISNISEPFEVQTMSANVCCHYRAIKQKNKPKTTVSVSSSAADKIPLGKNNATERKEKSSRYELKKRSSTGMFVDCLTRQRSKSDKSQQANTKLPTQKSFSLCNAN